MEMFYNPNCAVCDSSFNKIKFEFRYTSDEVLKKLEIADRPKTFLMQCQNCSHYFVQPQLHNKLISKYYEVLNSEFYDLNKQNIVDFLGKEHLQIKNEVEKNTKSGRVLEIGCGYGFLINMFENSKWERYAVEPSPHAANFVKTNFDIDIQNTGFEDAFFENEYFDVVLLFDVIEHLQDPQLLLNKINKVLKPGGFIYIGTGNIESLNAKMANKNWSYFGSWEHISFFSKNSVKFLLHKNDFKLVKLVHRSYKSRIKNYWVFFKNIIKYVLSFLYERDKKFGLAFDHTIIIAQSRFK